MFIFNFLIFYFFKFPALASLISAWLGGNIWLAAWQSDVWNDLLKDTSHHYWGHVTSLEWNYCKEKRGLQSKLIWLFSPLFGITKTCKFWRQVDTREWKVPHEQNKTDPQFNQVNWRRFLYLSNFLCDKAKNCYIPSPDERQETKAVLFILRIIPW